MNAVVFEHVRLSELPAAWRARLPKDGFTPLSQLTVRIEQEEAPQVSADAKQAALESVMANPMFGMWADREDMADVDAYVRALRAPRLGADGTRRKKTP